MLLSLANDASWVWEIKHVADPAVVEGERVDAAQPIGVIGEVGSLLIGLKEQFDPERERTDLPRYHCPLIALHPIGFIEMQLENIRQEDSARLGIPADQIEELTPCAVTTALPGPSDATTEVGESQ